MRILALNIFILTFISCTSEKEYFYEPFIIKEGKIRKEQIKSIITFSDEEAYLKCISLFNTDKKIQDKARQTAPERVQKALGKDYNVGYKKSIYDELIEEENYNFHHWRLLDMDQFDITDQVDTSSIANAIKNLRESFKPIPSLQDQLNNN